MYSQIGTYKFIELDNYESFELRKDSFVYEHSIGLCHGIIHGTISTFNDTIILNSDIQPDYTVNASYNDEIGKHKILFEVNNIKFPQSHGFRVYKGKDYDDLDFINDENLSIQYDTTGLNSIFIIPRKSLKKYERLNFILYRSNLRIQFDWRNVKVNKYTISFNDLPETLDYEFFTNKKAILTNQGLILLDKDNNQEKHYYVIIRKRKRIVKMSKRKRVKIYKKST